MNGSIFDYGYGVLDGMRHFTEMTRVVKNWHMLGLFYLGVVPYFDLEPRGKGRKKVRIATSEEFRKFYEAETCGGRPARTGAGVRVRKGTVEFPYRGKTLRFYYDGDAALADTLSLIREQFVDETYGRLRVNGRTVIDIGANVGDTAMYFALNGARHVYAFEPCSHPYGLAVRNVRRNGLEERITLLNAGCWSSDTRVRISDDSGSKSYSALDISKRGKLVRMLSLDTVAKRYCSGESVLKIDCEGGEYPIVLNASADTLRKFSRIMIEYHDGYKNLKKKLEDAGFTVRGYRPKTISYNYRLFGMIFAYRDRE